MCGSLKFPMVYGWCYVFQDSITYHISLHKFRIDVMFVFHWFCHNVFIVFERFLCFIVRFLVCIYKCYYIYVIKRGLFCYNVTTMLLYIFVLFFVHLMMLYYMCILLYRDSLMQISPLALTNFYQSHIFFFKKLNRW